MLRFDSLPKARGAGDIKRIGEVVAATRGWLTSEIGHTFEGVTMIITSNSDEAERLKQEINFFSNHTVEVLSFPDWETLPYDNFSPHQDIVSQRIATLSQLPSRQRCTLVVPMSTLLSRLSPVTFFTGRAFALEVGQTLSGETLRSQLTQSGYRAVDTVFEHGEFAVRGSIIDIFPMGTEHPIRIDLFDEVIDSLRTFDPESQRSLQILETFKLLPAHEFPSDKDAIERFRQNWRKKFDAQTDQSSIYKDVSNGMLPAGIEYYLPLFFNDSTATLFDYLPPQSQIIFDTTIEEDVRLFFKDVENRYEQRRYNRHLPILEPTELFIKPDELFSLLKQWARYSLSPQAEPEKPGRFNLGAEAPVSITIDPRQSEPLLPLKAFILDSNAPVLLCVESAGRREAMLSQLAKIQLKPVVFEDWQSFSKSPAPLSLIDYPIDRGINLPGQLQLITESELYGNRIFQRRRRKHQQDQSDQVVQNLAELNIDSPVVHIDHGVGRYKGLVTLEIEGQSNEFLMLEYANEAKLYVPVSSLHFISRYTGSSDEMAPLHRLGTEQWSKARKKAAEKARDAAAELLDIYARRAARKGFSFQPPDDQYERFAEGFPFEETPDQISAINAVVRDMSRTEPMDRLVCGDVGFGKTEVAMRAAFLAVESGKQVAVLVPTTLLAQQHHQNFCDRFADWPVTVEVISRFRSSAQMTSTIKEIESGKVDIIIGTHKLLQGDIRFSNLGLVIIDEEHRFGVQQKERLKSLRAEVDILTLTATPIPRTLNMAMSGIRDLSIIATPPAKRLSVKTFVKESDPASIKEAILRELLRGGQVYYLHNEVKTIEKTAQELAEWIPEARIATGHGQMRERELEQVMSDFYHKRHNVLVCTTIIETGIDIPNANTIIIDRADKFGLAQLHQLRGRVGRSHHQAYAYLLTPPVKQITKDAVKRLEAISLAHDLGAGFTLATHDLEIRGAGELLGEEQSGQIQSVGFSLYMEMLEQAVNAIKQGKTPDPDKPLHHGPEVNLRLPSIIPADYLPDVHTRLMMYKRIASAKDDSSLDELKVEMIDRFGLLPEPLNNLFATTSLKNRADQLGINKIEANESIGRIEFNEQPNIDLFALVSMVQQQQTVYKLEGSSKLKFSLKATGASRFEQINSILEAISVKS